MKDIEIDVPISNPDLMNNGTVRNNCQIRFSNYKKCESF